MSVLICRKLYNFFYILVFQGKKALEIISMKKNLFVCFFLLMVTGPAVAQFRIGPLAGASISRFIYEDETYKTLYQTGFEPGYHAGVVLNYRVTKLYSLQTELSLMKKGVDVRYGDEFVKIHNDAEFYYLSAPVLLRFSKHKIVKKQHLEFYVNVGPEVNYWLGGRGVLKTSEPSEFVLGNELEYQVSFDENQKYGSYMVVENPSRVQMALAAGGGFIFDLGRAQTFAIDLRASLGVGKSFHGKEDGGDYGLKLYSENLEGVHHTFSVTASYMLNVDLQMLLRKGKAKRR